MKLFVLTYASFSCVDCQIFSDTIGVFATKEEAVRAMDVNVHQDLEDGDEDDYWDINEMSADYSNDFSDEYKTYSIKEITI